MFFEELKAQDDQVLDWAKGRKDMFLPVDEDVQVKAAEILSKHGKLLDLKKMKSSADPFVIALAKIKGCAVVTEEKNSEGRPKIPNVCKDYKIPCLRLIDILAREGVKL